MADDRIFTGEDGKFLADKIIENAEAIKKKVDAVDGKGLSTNDYTSSEKTKLAGLSNYDDTALSERVTALEGAVEDMGGGASVTVDDALSDTSENPVQNKVISAALDGKVDVEDIPAAYDDTALTASVAALTAAVAEKADKSEVKHHVELTQAEYDALSDDEKNDGTVYFIKDGSTVGGVVDQTYDATSSNAQSGTAVAAAIAALGSSGTNAEALDAKVDKEDGKGLSTNDYTSEDKAKLEGLADIKSIGDGLTLDASTGELTANATALTAASSTVLGGIKVGSGLAIDANGVLSVSYASADTGVF